MISPLFGGLIGCGNFSFEIKSSPFTNTNHGAPRARSLNLSTSMSSVFPFSFSRKISRSSRQRRLLPAYRPGHET